MNNNIATTSPAETFRAIAADRMVSAAGMTLHELVDEFLRLQALAVAGRQYLKDDADDWGAGFTYTDEAKVALSESAIVNGAAKARFGIIFEVFDRDHL